MDFRLTIIEFYAEMLRADDIDRTWDKGWSVKYTSLYP